MKKQTKDNLTIITILLGTFLIPFLTTFLLELDFITRSTPRMIIIYLLIITEFAAGLMLLKAELKGP